MVPPRHELFLETWLIHLKNVVESKGDDITIDRAHAQLEVCGHGLGGDDPSRLQEKDEREQPVDPVHAAIV